MSMDRSRPSSNGCPAPASADGRSGNGSRHPAVRSPGKRQRTVLPARRSRPQLHRRAALGVVIGVGAPRGIGPQPAHLCRDPPGLQASSLHRLRLRLNDQIRLVDLRDGALARLGLDREQLTGAGGLHYPCTRVVAERIVGSKSSCGFVWTSRQGSLHAGRNPDGLASEVLRHDSRDVAVLSSPDAATALEVIESEPLVSGTGSSRFVLELANLLCIAIM